MQRTAAVSENAIFQFFKVGKYYIIRKAAKEYSYTGFDIGIYQKPDFPDIWSMFVLNVVDEGIPSTTQPILDMGSSLWTFSVLGAQLGIFARHYLWSV